MAKHRKHYRGLSSIKFGAFALPPSVPTKGLAMGLGVGLAGALVARYAFNSFLSKQRDQGIAYDANPATGSALWSAVQKNSPAVGAALAAVAAFFVFKKKNPALGAALAVGAGAFAATQGAFNVIATASSHAAAGSLLSKFKGLQVVALPGGRFGAMIQRGASPFGALFVGNAPRRLPARATPLSSYGSMTVMGRNARLQGVAAAHSALRNARR